MIPGFEVHKPLQYVYFNRKGKLPVVIFWVPAHGKVSGLVAGYDRLLWTKCVYIQSYLLLALKVICHTTVSRWDDPGLLLDMLTSAYRHIPKAYIGEIVKQVWQL